MEGACEDMQWQVKQREVAAETLAQEMRLEVERRDRMREIYRERRDLSISVEDAEEPG